jgi:hypothetical protein
VLQDIVIAEVVEGEGGCVGGRVGGDGKIKEEAAQCLVDVERVEQGVLRHLAGDVLAMVRKEAVVGEGVEHGAWCSHWTWLFSSVACS